MSKRRLDEKKLNEIKMKASRQGGHHGRFAGLKEKPKNFKNTLKKLLNYISYSKKSLIILIVFVIIQTVCNLSISVLLQSIIKSLGEFNLKTKEWNVEPNPTLFYTFLIIIASVYLLYCIMQYVTSLITAKISVEMSKKLRNDLFAKIVKLPIRYVDSHPHGDIMSRMTNDVDNISVAVGSSFSSIISGILNIVGCLTIMIVFSPLLTLVALVTLLLSLTLTFIMSKYMGPLFTKQQSILGLLNSQTEEMVTGCKTVMAYNHQDEAIEEFNEYSVKLKQTGIKAQIWGGSMGPIMNFIGNVGYLLVCFVGALFALNGIGGTIYGAALDISIILTFTTITKQFTRPINEMAQLYTSIITALAGAERVFTLMEEEVESFDKNVDFNPLTTDGVIDFENVCFSYVEGKPVLKNFSVDVRKGHKVALVGATGSGKTTIVNLLLRYYDVNSGTIKIDGININDISKKDLRDCISIVLQDAVLFSDTIENNVKYGKENASKEEIDNALKMANCYKFVNRLPDKENTMLNEGATNISQGQRQLLTIARAILADPKILILDEATSSVDTRTEKKIQDALVNLMKNRTSIIIAHRLSTIQDADFIVVLDQGKVVEMGNHKELIELNGVYNRLYQTQYKGLNT